MWSATKKEPTGPQRLDHNVPAPAARLALALAAAARLALALAADVRFPQPRVGLAAVVEELQRVARAASPVAHHKQLGSKEFKLESTAMLWTGKKRALKIAVIYCRFALSAII